MSDTFKHGIYTEELSTQLTPLINVASPTVVVGTAPLHMASDPAPINTPVLCQSYSEFVRYFGYSSDFASYTLCEAAQVFFQLYNVSPLIVINVLDPATHKVAGTKSVSGLSNPVEIDEPIILSSLVVKSGSGQSETTLIKDTDYTAAYNSADKVVLTILSANKITGDTAALTYDKVNASGVTSTDIIGGVELTTGKNTGLEAIEDVYPRLGLIPSTIIAPKWSTNSAVAAVMAAKCRDINGCFKAICAVDIDSGTVRKINDCNSAKNTNNLTDAFEIVCYPKVSLDGVRYNLSTHVAALMNRVDADNSDIPYQSPSNQSLSIDMSCLADGTELTLSKANANYLNGLGITTALNFAGGWRAWGNRTGTFPTVTDPKDSFIPVRRMFNWIANNIVVNFWQKIDMPITRRNVESVTDSINQWLSGLTARGAIVAGACYLLEELNPVADLAVGKIVFSLSITPPPPAEQIQFTLQYDAQALSSIFA